MRVGVLALVLAGLTGAAWWMALTGVGAEAGFSQPISVRGASVRSGDHVHLSGGISEGK
jgi:hypothetical protein